MWLWHVSTMFRVEYGKECWFAMVSLIHIPCLWIWSCFIAYAVIMSNGLTYTINCLLLNDLAYPKRYRKQKTNEPGDHFTHYLSGDFWYIQNVSYRLSRCFISKILSRSHKISLSVLVYVLMLYHEFPADIYNIYPYESRFFHWH